MDDIGLTPNLVYGLTLTNNKYMYMLKPMQFGRKGVLNWLNGSFTCLETYLVSVENILQASKL